MTEAANSKMKRFGWYRFKVARLVNSRSLRNLVYFYVQKLQKKGWIEYWNSFKVKETRIEIQDLPCKDALKNASGNNIVYLLAYYG